MRDALIGAVLRLLRVPPRPEAPPGDPDRVRTFRAAPRYFHYKVALWALGQATALIGLIAGWVALSYANNRINLPLGALFGRISTIEMFAWLAFLVQLPFSYAVVWLDFSMRWYMLSDHSLRIRDGALVVHEKTMTYANVQQITIRQNPLQRALGIATVAVRAAGGGGGEGKDKAGGEAREARFEGVANAEQIRDLIRERVRRHRDAGLGDTDEATHAARDAAPAATLAAGARVEPALAAARLLLEEARALRATARWR